jgi:nicotinamidase-related amidase
MQEMFAAQTAWHTPWMTKVLPRVALLAEAHAQSTIFTRFIPPHEGETVPGAWADYYERWPEMRPPRLDPVLLELVEPLRAISSRSRVVDKHYLSPFHGTRLAAGLRKLRTDTLIVTGAETDMCVLASILDAVDLGLRIVLVEDAVCSSSDEAHEAVLYICRTRFGTQIETAAAAEILERWRV